MAERMDAKAPAVACLKAGGVISRKYLASITTLHKYVAAVSCLFEFKLVSLSQSLKQGVEGVLLGNHSTS